MELAIGIVLKLPKMWGNAFQDSFKNFHDLRIIHTKRACFGVAIGTLGVMTEM
jgi:hypothetical protein